MKIRFDYTSDAILRSAASLFFRDPADVTLLSSSAREADDRAAATVTAGDGARYVLKLASNAFTHPRRIEGWTSLIRTARAMGVYMPALIPSLAGRIAETREIDGRPFVVWAEEFAPYPLAETQEEYGTDGYREKDAARPKSPDGCPAWQTELIRFNAKLAAARLPGGWGISGYARLAPPEDAETDEAEETLLEAERQIREKHPALLSRWRTLRAHWEENRDALARRGIAVRLLVQDWDKAQNAKLEQVLAEISDAQCLAGPDGAALLQWRRALNAGELRLPLAVAVGERGEGLFAFVNYNVGSVVSLIQVIDAR